MVKKLHNKANNEHQVLTVKRAHTQIKSASLVCMAAGGSAVSTNEGVDSAGTKPPALPSSSHHSCSFPGGH